jgi:2-keto-4-pentenoate hydratase/2-oxohepta-3-ene-1,7-dioic acid hydratase in catechol pathway
VHEVGRGSGGAIETVRLRAPSDEARFVEALADGLLDRWCALPGITTIRLLQRHGTAASSGGTAETALRGGPDREADWIILVEGTRPEALSEARALAGSDRVLDEAFGSGERERGLYRLQYDLSRSNEEVLMKLLRFGPPGSEKPGLLDADGIVRDASSLLSDVTPATIASGEVERLRQVDARSLPAIGKDVRIGPPLARPGNFIAIGLNYSEHATETGAVIPKEPILFNKAPSCIVGPHDDVRLPPGSVKSDWEVELAFVISRRAEQVSEADALDYVLGYTICNDVSEREFQLEHEGQWMKGKGCPTFGPLGPWLVTPDEIGDPQGLGLWLEVNGERMQTSSTATMIFPVRTLVSYLSRFMILEPGDLVTTGTPPGVGLGFQPPRYLKSGDVMRLGVEGLGEQRQLVR